MPASLDPQQRRVLAAFLRRANRQGATPVERKALVEAGLVEANLHNPNYGDRDSIGSLQERSGYGSTTRRLDPSLAARRFLTEARQLKTPGISAGELAQKVQRSGFPARYGQKSGEAAALLGSSRSSPSSPASSRTTTRTVPGVDRSDERKALILQWLQAKGRPGALETLATGLQGAKDTPSRTVKSMHGGSVADRSGGGRVASGSIRVAANANRPGIGLTPDIQRVLRQLSAHVGHPIDVGTGTNHNRLTVDGNVSDHWSGNAADIPTTPGAQNIRLGRNALLALGMPRDQAMKATGGIYNLPYGSGRRIQVIFNTNEGGDHHNHVHVGVTALRR